MMHARRKGLPHEKKSRSGGGEDVAWCLKLKIKGGACSLEEVHRDLGKKVKVSSGKGFVPRRKENCAIDVVRAGNPGPKGQFWKRKK